MLDDLWNDDDARNMGEPELLRYRSNLLGADLAVTNFGGGNTSAKVKADDPLTGHETTVLWVKGSGGDLELAYDFIGVIEGTATSRTPIETGIQSVYACLAAKESVEKGRFVEVRLVGAGGRSSGARRKATPKTRRK